MPVDGYFRNLTSIQSCNPVVESAQSVVLLTRNIKFRTVASAMVKRFVINPDYLVECNNKQRPVAQAVRFAIERTLNPTGKKDK